MAIEFHERKATSDLYLDTQNSFLKQVDFIQDFSVFGSGVSFASRVHMPNRGDSPGPE